MIGTGWVGLERRTVSEIPHPSEGYGSTIVVSTISYAATHARVRGMIITHTIPRRGWASPQARENSHSIIESGSIPAGPSVCTKNGR